MSTFCAEVETLVKCTKMADAKEFAVQQLKGMQGELPNNTYRESERRGL